jgi:hypothetical protein
MHQKERKREREKKRASLQHLESRKMQSQTIYGQRYMGNIKMAEQLVLGHLGDSSESAEFGFCLRPTAKLSAEGLEITF